MLVPVAVHTGRVDEVLAVRQLALMATWTALELQNYTPPPAADRLQSTERRMGFGEQIASRLKAMRRAQRAPQEVVAKAVVASVSAVSRLERGMRSLRVDQLVAWSGALGYRIDIVFWKPTFEDEVWDSAHPEKSMGLDDACALVLSEVAAAVVHLPGPARKALIHEMRTWKEDALHRRALLGPPESATPGRER